MKIAYLSVLPPPDKPAISGVYRVSESLLRQYEGLDDIEVEAVTLIDGLDREIVRQQGKVRYHFLPCKRRLKTATLYWAEIRALERRLGALEVDLVHGQPTAEHLLVATASRMPHVITVHGLVSRESVGQGFFHPGYFTARVREALQQRAVRRAQNIITISPYVADYLRPLTGARQWPLSNPIDAEFFSLPPPVRAGLRLLCVGILCERKNQLLLVEACQLLAGRGIQFECRLVGTSDPRYEARVRERWSAAGLAQHVLLTGPLSHEELRQQYIWANAVVLPSLEESSSLVLMQAMAGGRCAFGASAAALPYVLDHGRLGTLFAPATSEPLVQVLEEFVRNPLPFWDKARVAAAHAAAHFRADAVARATVAIYAEILAGATVPAS